MALLHLLFPPRCAACGRAGWPLCDDCLGSVPVVTPPMCARCGRPTPAAVPHCADCPPPGLDACRAPFVYRGPVRAAVQRLKFSGWHALAPRLAGAMVAALGDIGADVVTWVPLAPRRRSARGFDQAEVLARHVASLRGLPTRPLLRRRVDTREQARRSGAERRVALRDAFEPIADAPARVLLVDDVLTTGATAAACADALRRAGGRRVVVLAAARSLGGPIPARCYIGAPPRG